MSYIIPEILWHLEVSQSARSESRQVYFNPYSEVKYNERLKVEVERLAAFEAEATEMIEKLQAENEELKARLANLSMNVSAGIGR